MKQKRRCIFLMRLQPPSIHVNINEEQKREINEQEQSEKRNQGHEALKIHRRHQLSHPTPSPPRNKKIKTRSNAKSASQKNVGWRKL